MIYNARGEISLVWALGISTSPGREVGVDSNLLYFIIIWAFVYSSDARTPKTIIVTLYVTVAWLSMSANEVAL